jgi:Cof subfamily protein (haloacid dehalogenase superfamily)
MLIKMVVFDLDGTLLRTDKTISERTKEILRQCREAGIKTVYATGRGSDVEILAPSELFDGKISMNGAIAKVGDKTVYSCIIPCPFARQLLLACDKRGLKIVSQIGGVHYANFVLPDEWKDIVGNWEITDFSKHNKDAAKLFTYDLTPEDIAFITEILPEDLYMVIAVDGVAMIMHKNATKSKAVAVLADLWGIKETEIAAFGDDLNDIDLLTHVRFSVAMDNALDEVKAAARYVCDTNDNDGVAKWLEENVLKK